jgi:hypothetical protein
MQQSAGAVVLSLRWLGERAPKELTTKSQRHEGARKESYNAESEIQDLEFEISRLKFGI